MLYLLRPGGSIVWNDIPWELGASAHAGGANLTNLEWSGDTDQVIDDFKIRVALRHGLPCSAGIVVEGLTLRSAGDGDSLRTIHMQASEAQEELREHDPLMERLIPGWTAHGEELDARIAAESENEALRRDADARALLDAAPNPELVRHWEQLGGRVPDPV